MPENTVEFSGTIQSPGPQKITGTGKIVSSGTDAQRVSITNTNILKITFTITITITITLALTLEFLFEGRISGVLKTIEPSPSVEIKVEIIPEDSLSIRAALSTKLREFGIDGSIVIVDVFDNLTDAEYFESVLRQKRVHEKSLFFQSKYYVYVGPLYGRRASSVLQEVQQLGYTKAYILKPK